MPLDPILSLAVSMQASPGTYAVLLGSGVSAAAGIPTGYKVTQSLMQRLAEAAGVRGSGQAIEDWFRSEVGAAATYPEVLAAAAPEPAERQQVLRAFFEPTGEEREAGEKVPTRAHRAIADLAKAGYVRVIVTTNFDRLMEQALEAAGVAPTVISTSAQALGMEPVGRQGCLVLKVHGDYLDPLIKNTPEELAAYDPAINHVLDRIFDDYGIIVSGWSADSDTALREAIERAPSRRYTTYWGVRDQPSESARRLIEHRRAQLIQTGSADSLFTSLLEKVQAVEALQTRPPLTADVAVATLKRYLLDPLHRIRLHDLVMGEANRLAQWMREEDEARRGTGWHVGETPGQMARYETQTTVLRAMLTAGLYYDDGTHVDLWIQAMRRVALAADSLLRATHTQLTQLTWYPTLLLIYSAGLGALASKRYTSLARLLRGSRIRVHGKEQSILIHTNPSWVLTPEREKTLSLRYSGHPTPFNMYLSDLLDPETRPYLPDHDEYTEIFDLLEYLLTTVRFDVAKANNDEAGPLVGCFLWRYVDLPQHPAIQLTNEAARSPSWLTDSGLFSEISSFNQARAEVDRRLQHYN